MMLWCILLFSLRSVVSKSVEAFDWSELNMLDATNYNSLGKHFFGLY